MNIRNYSCYPLFIISIRKMFKIFFRLKFKKNKPPVARLGGESFQIRLLQFQVVWLV